MSLHEIRARICTLRHEVLYHSIHVTNKIASLSSKVSMIRPTVPHVSIPWFFLSIHLPDDIIHPQEEVSD